MPVHSEVHTMKSKELQKAQKSLHTVESTDLQLFFDTVRRLHKVSKRLGFYNVQPQHTNCGGFSNRLQNHQNQPHKQIQNTLRTSK